MISSTKRIEIIKNAVVMTATNCNVGPTSRIGSTLVAFKRNNLRKRKRVTMGTIIKSSMVNSIGTRSVYLVQGTEKSSVEECIFGYYMTY